MFSTIIGQLGRAVSCLIRGASSLDLVDFCDRAIERGGHQRMHLRRVVPFDEITAPSRSRAAELRQFLVRNAGENGRVGDLVAIEMQDRQHRAVGHGIEKLVGMPGRRQRAGFGFTVTDHARDDQIRIIKRRAKGMAERIAQLAAFMNGAGRLGRDMARESRRGMRTA